MDNQIFRINGDSDKKLNGVLELLLQDYIPVGYCISNTHGLIIYKNKVDKVGYFDLGIFNTSDDIFRLINKYLNSELTTTNVWSNVNLFESFTSNIDIDGTIKKGWFVYKENWGHVNSEVEALFAVKPCWCWYGK